MNVLDVMTKSVLALHESDTLATAVNVMNTENVRHIIVLSPDGSLAGILSDRDVRLVTQSPLINIDEDFTERVQIQQFMTPNPCCIDPQSSVQEAAQLMLEKHINALPVLYDKQVVGIITSTDLLGVLVKQSV